MATYTLTEYALSQFDIAPCPNPVDCEKTYDLDTLAKKKSLVEAWSDDHFASYFGTVELAELIDVCYSEANNYECTYVDQSKYLPTFRITYDDVRAEGLKKIQHDIELAYIDFYIDYASFPHTGSLDIMADYFYYYDTLVKKGFYSNSHSCTYVTDLSIDLTSLRIVDCGEEHGFIVIMQPEFFNIFNDFLMFTFLSYPYDETVTEYWHSHLFFNQFGPDIPNPTLVKGTISEFNLTQVHKGGEDIGSWFYASTQCVSPILTNCDYTLENIDKDTWVGGFYYPFVLDTFQYNCSV